jgi:N-acetylmuramoyl-L-alanine amidase
MLSIQNHRLTGSNVTYQPTPNVGGNLRPRFVVLHYTAGRSLESSVQSLSTRKPQGNASAHIVLGRDGRIVQLAPFNVVTWHAGVSQWSGLNGLNNYAIGIEMDNAGLLHREGDRFVSWFGKTYPADEALLAEHRHGGGVQPWHGYAETQIARALELCELLVGHYGLQDVLGHEDIARGRKVDPGPAFPLAAVRARALGRGADVEQRLMVTASSLNIRSGPGASFDKVAPALKKGAELIQLEPQDRWSRVAVVGITDLEGWVSNDFVAPMPASRGGPAVLSRSQRSVAPTRTRAVATKTRGQASATTPATQRRVTPSTKKAGARKTAARPSAARKAETKAKA